MQKCSFTISKFYRMVSHYKHHEIPFLSTHFLSMKDLSVSVCKQTLKIENKLCQQYLTQLNVLKLNRYSQAYECFEMALSINIFKVLLELLIVIC